jgi:hypothetical protein
VIGSGNYALTISVVQLWRDRDKRQQARDLLAPIYCWFTERFDTRPEGSESPFAQRAKVKELR